MAWLTDKARNLFSKGKRGEVIHSVELRASGGAKAIYHEKKLYMPLNSGHNALLAGALEQMQGDPEIRAILKKAGVSQLTKKQLAEDGAADSIRLRGQEFPEEEHRLLTVLVLLGNGDAKFHGGYFSSAEAAYREAYKVAGSTRDKSLQAVCLVVLAAAIGMQDKYEQALKQVESALRCKSDLAEAWYNKGVVLLMLARHKEAQPCFDEALRYKPNFTEAWYNKGVALGNLNRHEEALTCFDEALDYNPHDGEVWLGKGVTLLMLDLHKEAFASFEEALRHKAGLAGAWLGKGLALLMLDRYEEALDGFEEALRREPEFAEAWLGKGLAKGDLGRHEEAATCFDKALDYKPDLASAWHNRGVALERIGWWKQALSAYERAQALEKGKP